MKFQEIFCCVFLAYAMLFLIDSVSRVCNPDLYFWSGDDSSVWCSGAWLTAQLGHIGRRPIAWLHLPCRADSGSKLCQRDSLALLPHSRGSVYVCQCEWDGYVHPGNAFISIYTFTERNQWCKEMRAALTNDRTVQPLFDVISNDPLWIISQRNWLIWGPDREDWQESGKSFPPEVCAKRGQHENKTERRWSDKPRPLRRQCLGSDCRNETERELELSLLLTKNQQWRISWDQIKSSQTSIPSSILSHFSSFFSYLFFFLSYSSVSSSYIILSSVPQHPLCLHFLACPPLFIILHSSLSSFHLAHQTPVFFYTFFFTFHPLSMFICCCWRLCRYASSTYHEGS